MLKIELEQSGNTLLCRATQRGEELGRAEAEIREDTVWYRSGWLEDPEDYGLLGGLVRAAFDAARSAGVKEYFVSGEAAGEYRRAFEVYDYALDQAEELERFFGRHSCKGQSGGF